MSENFDFASVLTADFERGRLYWKNPPKNHAQRAGNEAGAINVGKGKNKTYWQVRAFGRTFKRARVIFYMAYGRWPEPAVDHINGDSLDDRLSNLRECTLSLNAINSRDKARIYDLPRGVYLTRQGRFIARITRNGATTNLGTFDTPAAAQHAFALACEGVQS